MTNPDKQDIRGLRLTGRIALHPLRASATLELSARGGEYVDRSPRVRRAPNPDGPGWRAEDDDR